MYRSIRVYVFIGRSFMLRLFDCSVGVNSDGTVVAVGDNENERCYVGDWTDIVAVSGKSLPHR